MAGCNLNLYPPMIIDIGTLHIHTGINGEADRWEIDGHYTGPLRSFVLRWEIERTTTITIEHLITEENDACR